MAKCLSTSDGKSIDLCKNCRETPCCCEVQVPVPLNLPPNSSNDENTFYIDSSNPGSFQSPEKDDSCDLFLSDNDSSLYKTYQYEKLSPCYVNSPSLSKLKKFKQAFVEVNDKYLDWMISELVLSQYKTIYTEMPPHTSQKVEDIIKYSKVLPHKAMKTRRGDTLNLLGIEEDDFAAISKKCLLSSEKKELSNKMMMSLSAKVQKLIEEKNNLKGTFGSHCLKVTPADTALSEERLHQAQMNNQMRLWLDQGCESVISSSQMIGQLAQLEVNAAQKLQKVSYSSLKDKAKHLCNNLSIVKHKIDQIALADVNYTRSTNEAGDSLKTSIDSLSDKKNSLLKLLEKYERKENMSKTFNDIVAEYAKTKRQLHHKLQTLQVLNEPRDSFS